MRRDLFELVWERDELAELDAAERRLALRSLVAEKEGAGDLAEIVRELAEAIDGYGPLAPLMRDEAVTDILVNGPFDVWVERAGRLQRAGARFADHDHLLAFVERALGDAGRRVDASHPIADAGLADGSRIHVVLPPIAPDGPLVSIRRFPRRAFSVEELAARHMLTPAEADFLVDCVRTRRTIAISGGTGTGKTTLLSALLGRVDPGERVVLVEETRELRPGCSHAISLVYRAPNTEGRGKIDQTMLLRAALRMRPDRIVVGEVRGPEALVALAAMTTGHEGSMVTIHARSARDAVDRMLALALQGDSGATEESLRRQVLRAFDVVVHLGRDEGGRRRVESVMEVDGESR